MEHTHYLYADYIIKPADKTIKLHVLVIIETLVRKNPSLTIIV
jgi:hypothetical protein